MTIDASKCSVLITGGTQGLGFSVAENLVKNGCKKIIISGRDTDKGYKAADLISSKDVKCYFIRADVSQVDDCKNLFEQSIKHFGHINSLVNSAAITTRGTIQDTSLDLWDQHINTNLRAPFILIQSLTNHLIALGKKGSVVNILSLSGYVGQSFLTAYSTSKGGLMTLTKNAANALKNHNIRVNAVAPGWMDTPGEDEIQKKFHTDEEIIAYYSSFFGKDFDSIDSILKLCRDNTNSQKQEQPIIGQKLTGNTIDRPEIELN